MFKSKTLPKSIASILNKYGFFLHECKEYSSLSKQWLISNETLHFYIHYYYKTGTWWCNGMGFNEEDEVKIKYFLKYVRKHCIYISNIMKLIGK